MTRLIACLAVAAATVAGSRMVHRTRADTLPFYRDSTRTPEWIAPGSGEYDHIHHVADFHLLDQQGRVVSRASLAGKIYVASFFFTRCRDLCPRLHSNLSRVQAAFRGDSTVVIVSHTVAPAQDDTAALRRYAQMNGVDSRSWHLVTGPVDEIARLARQSYFAQLPDSIDGTAAALAHSETLTLVDGQGRVRGVYDGSLPYDVDRLIDDVRVLEAAIRTR